MKRLSKTLQDIKRKKEANSNAVSIMSHAVIGYPSFEKSIEIVQAMEDGGASIIELQIPFSDPLADGPTIMAANQKALDNGITPKDCFSAMQRLSAKVKVPLLFMTYFNIPFKRLKRRKGLCQSRKSSRGRGAHSSRYSPGGKR